MIRIDKAESVIVRSADSRANRLYLPENLRLRGKNILCVWMIENPVKNRGCIEDKNSKWFEGAKKYPLMDPESIQSEYLVLVKGDSEVASKIPLQNLIDRSKAGKPYIIDDSIDFSHSYIERWGEHKEDGEYCFVFGITDKARNKENGKKFHFEHVEVPFELGTPIDTERYVPQMLEYDAAIGVRKNNFPDTESFRGRLLREISLYCSQTGDDFNPEKCKRWGYPLTPDGKWAADRYIVEKSMLTLVDTNGEEICYRIPIEMFMPTYSTEGVAFQFNDLSIDWRRSYVEDFSRLFLQYKKDTILQSEASFYFGITFVD